MSHILVHTVRWHPTKIIGNVLYVYRSNFLKQQSSPPPPPKKYKKYIHKCYETHTHRATKANTQLLNTRLDTIIKFEATCISIFKDNIGIGSAYDTISFLHDVTKWCNYWMNGLACLSGSIMLFWSTGYNCHRGNEESFQTLV